MQYSLWYFQIDISTKALLSSPPPPPTVPFPRSSPDCCHHPLSCRHAQEVTASPNRNKTLQEEDSSLGVWQLKPSCQSQEKTMGMNHSSQPLLYLNPCALICALWTLQCIHCSPSLQPSSARSTLRRACCTNQVPPLLHAHTQKRTGFHHACRPELRGDHGTQRVSPLWRSKPAMGMAGGWKEIKFGLLNAGSAWPAYSTLLTP